MEHIKKTKSRRKPQYKSEYAASLGVCVQTVNNWIEDNTALYRELVIAGYSNKYNKMWTPGQLNILDKYLK